MIRGKGIEEAYILVTYIWGCLFCSADYSAMREEDEDFFFQNQEGWIKIVISAYHWILKLFWVAGLSSKNASY